MEDCPLTNAVASNKDGYAGQQLSTYVTMKDSELQALQQRIIDLEGRNARLADALIESAEWLETRPDYTEGDAATSSSTRAALTVPDRQAGERLRALEDLLVVAQSYAAKPDVLDAYAELRTAVRAVKEVSR